MPKELCTVKYNNLDAAVTNCLKISRKAREILGTETMFLEKTDLSSAFCLLPLMVKCFCLLILKAEDPATGIMKYFVDECLPFGASISCALYQKFSDALRHIIEYRTGRKVLTNYLDDFLFIAITKWICDQMIAQFIELCRELNIPVVVEKTEWVVPVLSS